MSTVYQQSRTREIYGATITLTIIATAAVILRFISRKISTASFWWDDWTILIALVTLSERNRSNDMYADNHSRSCILVPLLAIGFGPGMMDSGAIQYMRVDP